MVLRKDIQHQMRIFSKPVVKELEKSRHTETVISRTISPEKLIKEFQDVEVNTAWLAQTLSISWP